ncbi:MAG: 3-methyl-2-oxobutanoate hydroxymethyltransferase [Cellvibrionaceae bacterium]|jgi:3-methyl-2-oxobutanoate hydroxymethyltransferase
MISASEHVETHLKSSKQLEVAMSTIVTALEKAVTIHTLQKLKSASEKFACIALYDAPLAKLAEQSGVESIIVGDSLGMTIQGHGSTLPVTLDQMVYHTAAVRRGNSYSLLIADLPFMTYATVEQAMVSATQLMQAGANMVKLEGGAWLFETVSKLSERGIPVCVHLGLTPQSVNKLGGYRVQGRDKQQAESIVNDAKKLKASGASLLVLECIPSTLTQRISREVEIVTIGIGAGNASDGQVLVITDMLGITPKPPKFAKNYLVESGSVESAINRFVKEVKAGQFPTEQHGF